MEVQRSEDRRSISYCCGWGLRASRGPNPLLQAQLGGLRMVPVPWLTSSKPAQMSWSPPKHTPPPDDQHTHTHTQIPPLLKLSLDPATKTKHSGDISYHESTHSLFELVSVVSHLLCSTSFLCFTPRLWSWEGWLMVSAVLWHQAWSDFWMTLAWKWVWHSQYNAALRFKRVFKKKTKVKAILNHTFQ